MIGGDARERVAAAAGSARESIGQHRRLRSEWWANELLSRCSIVQSALAILLAFSLMPRCKLAAIKHIVTEPEGSAVN